MKLRRLLLALPLLVASTPCWPQQAVTMQKPLPLTSSLRKTVAFLRVRFTKDGRPWDAYGTGFWVVVEDKRLGENQGFIYLVTNRHVAEPQENGKKYPVTQTFLRLNLKHAAGGQESAENPMPVAGPLHWYFSHDESVDLAVFPIAPSQDKVDFEVFPESMFATREVVETDSIAEGDLVLYTGYFSDFPGLKRVQPIVREGILAMVPEETLETTLHKPGHLYLADIHVFEGNSGGPLFVNVAGFRNGVVTAGGFPYRLLGVVSGFFTEDSDFRLTVATTLEGRVHGNSGIATVVPADELRTLLDMPELQKLRDAEVARQQVEKKK